MMKTIALDHINRKKIVNTQNKNNLVRFSGILGHRHASARAGQNSGHG